MIFCIVPDSINAKDIFSIDINPLNRAIIHFDTIPLKYSSNLSDDKKRIYINVGNYTFKDNIKQKSGLGIINDIYLTKSDSGTVVNIRTKEKRGYTIVNYPFSSRLAVEVFSWENLTKEEEAYRTALLAFEDGIYTEALREFYFLSKKNYIPSVYFLGMIYLKSKNFSQAATAFRFVIQNDSNNIDALAGYSVAAMNLGENNYQQYLNSFFAKCNCNNYINSEIIDFVPDSTFMDVSHLVLNIADTSKVQNDSTSLANSELKIDSTKISKNQKNTINVLGELYTYLFYILGAIGILILYLYLKWRNQKSIKLKSKIKNEFTSELKTAQSGINSAQIINAYKKQEDIKTDNDSMKTVDEGSSNEKSSNIVSDEKIIKLESIIENITGKPVSVIKNQATIPGVNAKLELAMHLADEQRKIKAQNIDALKTYLIPNDKKKLAEVSKKLGIEKGGLETKAALEKILKDKDKLKKLNDKFGI